MTAATGPDDRSDAGSSAQAKRRQSDVELLQNELETHRAELAAQELEKRDAEAAAVLAAERYLRLFRTLPVPCFVTDGRGWFVDANAAAERFFGYTLEQLRDRPFSRLLRGESGRTLRRMLESEFTPDVVEHLEVRTVAGSFEVEVHVTPLPIAGGGRGERLFVLVDRSRERTLIRSLQHRASHDTLTGLLNREGLISALTRDLDRQRSQVGAIDRHALIFVDLDHFKWVNDTLGHDVGDAILQEVGQLLGHLVRPNDLLARISGDEFVIVLRHLEHVSSAARVAGAIVEQIGNGVDVAGQRVATSVSVGVALAPDDSDDAGTLIKHADAAMYAAKQSGRATWCMFDQRVSAELETFFRVRSQLEDAIRNDLLCIYAQPVVRLDDQAVVGHEVLVRMQTAEGQILTPAEFLSVALASGQVREIGRWVRSEAWGAIALGRLAVDGNYVAINVSPSELHAAFAEELAEELARFGIDPARIVVEITEDALFSDRIDAAEMCAQLATTGVRLALDDFGTGYASLAQLIRLPLDIVKLDRSLLLSTAEQPGLLTAILALCHELDVAIVAEGIESADQAALLRAGGCRFAQGFYFGRPAPVSGSWP